MEFPDQRRNLRIQLLLCGQLSRGNGENYVIETQNVSLKGARIAPHPTMQGIGSRHCILTLFANVQSQCAITFDGWLIYTEGNGYGIEFQAVDQHDFRLFEALMKEHAPEPERFQQEVEQGFIPALKDWAMTCIPAPERSHQAERAAGCGASPPSQGGHGAESRQAGLRCAPRFAGPVAAASGGAPPGKDARSAALRPRAGEPASAVQAVRCGALRAPLGW